MYKRDKQKSKKKSNRKMVKIHIYMTSCFSWWHKQFNKKCRGK